MRTRKGLVIAVVGVLAVASIVMAAGKKAVAGRGGILAQMVQADEPNRPIANAIRSGIRRLVALRDELKITDEQRTQIKQVVQSHREELVPVVKDVVSKRQALRRVVLADSPSEEAIRAAADELGKSIGNAAVVVSKVAAEVKPILTEDQKKALRDFQADRQLAMENLLSEVLPDSE